MTAVHPLRRLRARTRMTGPQMAAALGIAYPTYAEAESGRRMPSRHILAASSTRSVQTRASPRSWFIFRSKGYGWTKRGADCPLLLIRLFRLVGRLTRPTWHLPFFVRTAGALLRLGQLARASRDNDPRIGLLFALGHDSLPEFNFACEEVS